MLKSRGILTKLIFRTNSETKNTLPRSPFSCRSKFFVSSAGPTPTTLTGLTARKNGSSRRMKGSFRKRLPKNTSRKGTGPTTSLSPWPNSSLLEKRKISWRFSRLIRGTLCHRLISWPRTKAKFKQYCLGLAEKLASQFNHDGENVNNEEKKKKKDFYQDRKQHLSVISLLRQCVSTSFVTYLGGPH